MSYVKAVFPSAPLTQIMRIAVALEQCQPNTQLVRVPWKPQTDHNEITKIYSRYLRKGYDPEDPRVAEAFDKEVAQVNDTYAAPLPDGWGTTKDAISFMALIPTFFRQSVKMG